MSDILSKFDSIQIENTNRIDEDDKSICEKFNKIYAETLGCYKNTLDSLISLYNNHIHLVQNSYEMDVSMYSGRDNISISGVIRSIIELKNSFINNICNHFSKKYKVTINNNKIYNKYQDKEIEYTQRENKDKTLNKEQIIYNHLDYNIILDEIIIQLNGFSFREKAIDEIKKKAKMPLHYYEYRKYWNYEIKGKTIKFRVGIKDILPALYYYDNNETGLVSCFTHNRIDDYKSYENGNTNIKFINAQYALDFAKRYLGYIEMSEEEREIYKKKCSSW